MNPELLQEMLKVPQPVNDVNDAEWNNYFNELHKVSKDRDEVDLFMKHHMTRFDNDGELKKSTLGLAEKWMNEGEKD